MPNIFGLILTCVIVVIVFSLLLFLIKRYKKCPSDKVMVIYGKVGSNKDGSTRSAKCIHGGAAFIWPVIQSYEFLDLTPMSISVDLENASTPPAASPWASPPSRGSCRTPPSACWA